MAKGILDWWCARMILGSKFDPCQLCSKDDSLTGANTLIGQFIEQGQAYCYANLDFLSKLTSSCQTVNHDGQEGTGSKLCISVL